MDERDDLPRIVRAGRHIARPKRYLRNYADEVEPDALVTAVERQAARGDGWVKLVGDWIDREVGDLTPLWPAAVAKAGIDRAHELGCRVTAHVFGEQAVSELVEAGIDGIEHGTGLDAPTIALMAERQVALVPTMIQLENFPGFAEAAEAKFPAYARRIRSLYDRRLETFGAALDAGVPIYAGTDAGGYLPHGIVGREIAAMGAFMSAEQALGRRLLAGPGLARPPRRARRGGAGRPRHLRRRPARRPARAQHPGRRRPAGTPRCLDVWPRLAATAALGLVPLLVAVPAQAADERVVETVLAVPGTPEPDGSPVSLDATLLTTDPGAARPAVVLAHGLGGTKADSLPTARSLARDGYAVLVYTARGFGASGGLVHLDDPAYEGRDAVAMVDALAARPEVERVGDGPGGRVRGRQLRRGGRARGRGAGPADRRDRARVHVRRPHQRARARSTRWSAGPGRWAT